ncbi:hypothetical protein U876_06585 [Aeromonas hydrophila NJ-35]|nr:hypothetical protein AHML_16120 [Aeromonas hydrophila ML09-119]AHX33628.1 hypothetical protein V428_16655 [Aeromonas hydrophila subsp. hydrophila AL09-71]AHX70429.1 hypothetical protein V429_16690 [Aeromonas hydrophila pc104A]AJE38583.1 hypothetical protein V469_06605 [Aeromonas hydrophila J-1]AKJ36998.1 hypothetical protein U876_06585 [Aeromonas hydrophila NJ-35]ALQ62606.1 hypothetical protein AS145_06770 [Aeromonas hydrophila]
MGKQGLAPALVSLYAPSPLMATGAGRSAAGETLLSKGRTHLLLNRLGAGQDREADQGSRLGGGGKPGQGDKREEMAVWQAPAGSPITARFTLQEVNRGMGKQRDKTLARVG